MKRIDLMKSKMSFWVMSSFESSDKSALNHVGFRAGVNPLWFTPLTNFEIYQVSSI